MKENSTKKVLFFSVLILIALLALVGIVLLATKTIQLPGSLLKEKEAVEKVGSLEEVKGFLRQVPGGLVEVDHIDEATNSYVVHVYEIKDGHTATLNWYNVNRKTGEITKEFDFEPVAEESAELSTFTNSQYGIQIQYPQDWTANYKTQLFEKGDLVTFEKIGATQTTQTDFFDGGRLTIALPFEEGKSPSDWAKDYYSKWQQNTQYSTEKLAGEEFLKVSTCGNMGCSTYYHTKRDGLIYGIYIFAEGKEKTEYQQAISQMLQTLELPSSR